MHYKNMYAVANGEFRAADWAGRPLIHWAGLSLILVDRYWPHVGPAQARFMLRLTEPGSY